jgi:hypothetical protein
VDESDVLPSVQISTIPFCILIKVSSESEGRNSNKGEKKLRIFNHEGKNPRK